MPGFKSQIARHRDTLNELHKRIHSTFKVRDRSEAHNQARKDGCSAFLCFLSAVNDYMDGVSAEVISEDKKIRQLVFDFLSVDPIYFRSGYEKRDPVKAAENA